MIIVNNKSIFSTCGEARQVLLRYFLCIFIATGCVGFYFSAWAATEPTPVGRYVTISQHASAQQRNPLAQLISLTFPTSVKTLGQAMAYVLMGNRY